MPRKLPPYVVRQRTRHGQIVFYFRQGKGKRIRLPTLGTPEFEEAYQSARQTILTPTQKPQERQDALAWLIGRYQASSAYRALSKATQKQRDNIFRHVVKESGDYPFAAITADDLREARERRKDTPAQARNVLDAYRGLFRWALEAGHVATDPTEGVRKPPRREGPGFVVWTAQDVAKYRAKWPIGSVQRLWLEVLLGTGGRRGDAVRIGWRHVRRRIATLETEKKKKRTILAYIPISRELARALWANGAKANRDTWIVGDKGRPLTKESFGNLFRMACDAAGVDKSAHGLRKLAATIDAEGGLTVEQMKAVYGWTSDGMASHYTRSADRLRLAQEAAKRRK